MVLRRLAVPAGPARRLAVALAPGGTRENQIGEIAGPAGPPARARVRSGEGSEGVRWNLRSGSPTFFPGRGAPFGCRPFSGLGEDGLQGARPDGTHLVVEDGIGGFDAPFEVEGCAVDGLEERPGGFVGFDQESP